MEQHPVPQNVTTFQFRLIGDMTLKQFGYLIAGAILAFIAYKLPLPLVITWPLTGAFAFLGIGFAFIPVEERPMDVWVFSFFKSIYSPTQYIWSHEASTEQPMASRPPTVTPQQPTQKQPVQVVIPIVSSPTTHTHPPTSPAQTKHNVPAPPQSPIPSTTQKSVLSGLFQPTQQQTHQPAHPASTTLIVPQPRLSLIDELFAFFQPKSKPPTLETQIPHTQPTPVPSVTGHRPPAPTDAQPTSVNSTSEHNMHEKMTHLEETLKNLEARLATKTTTENQVLELQQQLKDALHQKNKTEDELASLKRTLGEHTLQPTALHKNDNTPNNVVVPENTSPATQTRGTVNIITTQEAAIKVGLPRLTNAPNVITGLVKDDAGNFLPGILVTVTSRDGVPVRALKTNKLGQFAASTPLSSDIYFVEIEDPRKRFAFSRVQITLNGSVVPVLEIIAKSEKALTRDRLAQEIFGKPSI